MNDYNQMRGGFIQVAGIVAVIVGLITNIAQLLLRHPFVLKMLLFTVFITLITSAISFMIAKIQPYIISNDAIAMASYFGVTQGLALFISIIISGFGVKQVLAFIRST